MSVVRSWKEIRCLLRSVVNERGKGRWISYLIVFCNRGFFKVCKIQYAYVFNPTETMRSIYPCTIDGLHEDEKLPCNCDGLALTESTESRFECLAANHSNMGSGIEDSVTMDSEYVLSLQKGRQIFSHKKFMTGTGTMKKLVM